MLKKDIVFTLLAKFTLLYILWFLCFSAPHKIHITDKRQIQHFIGSQPKHTKPLTSENDSHFIIKHIGE